MNFTYLLKKPLLSSLVASCGFGLLSGCATSDDIFRQNDSPLPIEVLDSTGGAIRSTRAFETATKLYVAGAMQKHLGSHLGTAAHVDVQLLDHTGSVVAEKVDDITPRHPRTSHGRGTHHSYVVSFPLETARKASTIRVAYHPVAH